MLRPLLALILLTAAPFAHAMDVPVLRLKPYASLAFPPQLPKDALIEQLGATAFALHGLAFENLGDMSDWMHGHVLFRPRDGAEKPAYPLTDPSWTPDWAGLELKGILFHTQEYDHLRGGRPYVGPAGRLDPYDRNWLLLFQEAGARLARAIDWMEKEPAKRPYTIRSDDLRRSEFGAKPGAWEFSVYFFRVKCENLAGLDPAALADSNAFTLALNGERHCLVFESFLCRNYSKTDPRCQQGVKLDYESPF